MRVLGVSAHFHTAAAALVDNGRLVGAAAEERFSRVKHDPAFPELTIGWLLGEAGLRGADLDAVVFYEQPHVKFTRVLASTIATFPRHHKAFGSAMKRWLGDRLWTTNKLSRLLDVHPDRVGVVVHHRSHASQAFVGSGFDESATLTLDGVGEWDTTGIGHAKVSNGHLDLDILETHRYPDSLGLFYAAFTTFLGFRANSEECSTMALATFGEPRYAHIVRQILKVGTDGSYRFDNTWFDFVSLGEAPFTKKLVAALGQPRTPGTPLPFESFRPPGAPEVTPSEDHQRFADIAASAQLVLEEAILGLANRAARLTGSKRICLSGGVALNCVATRRLLDETPFEECWIPPDPGDGGAALGAVQHVLGEHGQLGTEARNTGPYLGRSYDPGPTLAMLQHMGPNDWAAYRRPDLPPADTYTLSVERLYDDEHGLIARVVDDLLAGRIVGWFQGGFEFGPRALGHRSLLAHPARLDTAFKLSTRVKSRAPFRPYAFSITEADSLRAFPQWASGIPHLARWMQVVAPVSEAVHDHVRATLHIDNTTRPQIVRPSDNPRYHRLLEAFGAKTGLAALLNTSFNARGEPIVASPEEALMVFARTDLDTLVLGDAVLRKVYG
mgnify:CR=1 FL=1